MPLINTSLPNLIQGVSQQPDAVRYDGQCEEQENALSSVVEGLQKRPAAEFVGTSNLIDTALSDDTFFHLYKRSDEERYCITQDNNTLRIHNADTGVKCAITEQETSDFTITNNEVDTTGTYFASTKAKENLKGLTIGDSTFLLNKEQETAIDETQATTDVSDDALIFIKQGDYKKTYGFEIDGKLRLGAGAGAVIKCGYASRYITGVGYRFKVVVTSSSFVSGGTGFAVNDVCNIVLPQSRTVIEEDDDGNETYNAVHNLNLYIQPTIRVLSVNAANGAIIAFSLEEAGGFAYCSSTGTKCKGFNEVINNGLLATCNVPSSNNSNLDDIGGEYAQVSVLQTAITSSVSIPHRYKLSSGSLTIIAGGTGFAVDDIVDIPLPPTRNYPNSGSIMYLSIGTQPTMKVLSIDSNGKILTAQIEEVGAYHYAYAGNPFYMGYGTSVNFNNNSSTQPFTSGLIPSTLNTTPTTPPLNIIGAKSYTSAKANGNDASVIDSSVILTGIGTGGTGGVPLYFTYDTSHVLNNLLILKTNKLPSGQSVLQHYNIRPVDGLSGNGIGVVHREVSSLADLPLIAPHNYKVKVIGDAELGQDDFYCEFKSASAEPSDGDVGQGSWVECAGAVVNDTIDSATMPRMFVSIAPDEFEIRRMSFNKLRAGDTDSNPYPSFLDNKISNIFQYKNRLGLLSQDTVIMSEAGFGGYDADANVQSYNFFRTTVTDLLDGDPIDVSVSSNDVTTLRSAQPFQENLILFSDNSQFVLKGGELLTPKSVSVTAVTNFDTVKSVDPIPLGSYLYFPFQRGGFSGVREFTINATADIYDAVEITAHVPQYIPNNLTSLTGSNSEQIIAMTSGATASSGSETDIYIYKYFFNNQQKGLSSWSKFSVVGAVRGIKFIDSELYVLQSKNGKTNLLRIFLEAGRQDPSGYNTHLDMRISATVGGAVSDIQLPYTPESTGTGQVYTTDGLLLESSVNGSVVTLTTPPSATTNVYVGLRYSMKYVFSRLVFKAPSGNSKSPSNANDFLIRNGSIFFNNSASFKVKVQPDGREEQVNEFTPTVIGTQLPDEFKLTDGAFRFPIFTKASSAKITLENNTALPCNLQSAEFESFIHARSNRYG